MTETGNATGASGTDDGTQHTSAAAEPHPIESEPSEPRLRDSPLAAVHERLGAALTDFAGWRMPLRYSGDLAEHRAVREAAGLFDLSHMGEILVLGREAGVLLDRSLVGRLSAIAVGRAKYSLLVAPDGGVIDDLVVYHTGEDRYLVVANAANTRVVAAELAERGRGLDAVVQNESDDVALVAVQGPAALGILLSVPAIAVDGGRPDGEDAAAAISALKHYRALAGYFEGAPMLIARTGYTGEDGFELYVAPEKAAPLWEALTEAGADRGLLPAGLAARDTLRLEAGMALYGHELGRDVRPEQAGLARVIDLEKPGGFVGADALRRPLPEDAPLLVGLEGAGRRAARAGYAVYAEDAEATAAVGRVTSGVLSPTLGHPVAMAYVHPASAGLGTRLTVDVRGTRLPVTVTALPFYRRKQSH